MILAYIQLKKEIPQGSLPVQETPTLELLKTRISDLTFFVFSGIK
jgi:hypothetical protein